MWLLRTFPQEDYADKVSIFHHLPRQENTRAPRGALSQQRAHDLKFFVGRLSFHRRSFARGSRPVDAPQAAGRLRRLFRQRARAAPRTRARAPTRHNLQSKAGPRTLRQRVRAAGRPGARETRALRDVLTRVKTARRSEQSSRARVRLTRRRATRSSKRSVSEREAQPAPKRCTDTQHTAPRLPLP